MVNYMSMHLQCSVTKSFVEGKEGGGQQCLRKKQSRFVVHVRVQTLGSGHTMHYADNVLRIVYLEHI